MVKNFDIVVLGGGPAALATATTLRLQGDFSVLVVDAGLPERERAGESAPPDLLRPLRHLKLSEKFLSAAHSQSPGSAVSWGREQIGYNDHLLNPMGPAWRLNRKLFDAMLLEEAVNRGVSVLWQTRYVGMNKKSDSFHRYQLVLYDSKNNTAQEINASWVVDATGPSARFANDLGVKKKIDDQLFALACFRTIHAGEMTMQTFVEAVEQGWCYAARLPDERVVNLFVSEAETLRQIKKNNFQDWNDILNHTKLVGPILSRLKLSNPTFQTFPIYSSQLEQVTGENWLAVGDAASCYDPIAAQGLYKALRDGVTAGRAIAKALNNQSEELEKYASGIKARYAEYYSNRSHLYGLEQRWQNSAFWSERWKASSKGLQQQKDLQAI